MSVWAQDFYEIQDAVDENGELRDSIIDLVETKPIHRKAVEGGNRVESLREILIDFFEGKNELEESIQRVSAELPRRSSRHTGNNHAFSSGWDERLVRTQASRFYNQAVLLLLKERGEQNCHTPHSSHEKRDSDCTRLLAGNNVEVDILLDRLERTYDDEDYHDEVKIPNHPHCTHTITPIS